MLLIEIKELESYLPTGKWRDANKLLSYVEEEEQHVLIPILGNELFDDLVGRYMEAVGTYGGVTPDLFPASDVDIYIKLIRICQKVQLYMAMANNIGLFAVSFNQGGGFNVASSENYDAAGKDALDRLEKDSFRKAHRNIDYMLSVLEYDAKSSEPKFADKWMNSEYFYFHDDLLISRSIILQRYLNINHSRERYIELVPDLRYAQNTYLEPALGCELMQAFVDRNTKVVPPVPEPVEGEGGVDDTPTQEWIDEQRLLWIKAEGLLRAAEACYAEHRNVKMRRSDSLTDADMSLARAIALIREHQEYFMPYVQSAPFYVEPVQGEEQETDPNCICGEPAQFDPCDPGNAITVLNPGLRRF